MLLSENRNSKRNSEMSPMRKNRITSNPTSNRLAAANHTFISVPKLITTLLFLWLFTCHLSRALDIQWRALDIHQLILHRNGAEANRLLVLNRQTETLSAICCRMRLPDDRQTLSVMAPRATPLTRETMSREGLNKPNQCRRLCAFTARNRCGRHSWCRASRTRCAARRITSVGGKRGGRSGAVSRSWYG